MKRERETERENEVERESAREIERERERERVGGTWRENSRRARHVPV